MKKSKELITSLLAAQIADDIKFKEDLKNNPDFEYDLGDGIDVLNIIADFLGVPEDNSCDEEDLIHEMAQYGIWPDGVYCRDWLYFAMDEIAVGTKTIKGFIDEMEEQAFNFPPVEDKAE